VGGGKESHFCPVHVGGEFGGDKKEEAYSQSIRKRKKEEHKATVVSREKEKKEKIHHLGGRWGREKKKTGLGKGGVRCAVAKKGRKEVSSLIH